MALPSFIVTGQLYDIPGTVLSGELYSQALMRGRVMCTSNLDPDMFIAFEGGLYRPPTKVYADVNAFAELVDKDGHELRLLANDEDLSLAGIQWTITVLLPMPGRIQRIELGPFNAPAAGDTLSLVNIIPEMPADPTGPDMPEIIDGGSL